MIGYYTLAHSGYTLAQIEAIERNSSNLGARMPAQYRAVAQPFTMPFARTWSARF